MFITLFKRLRRNPEALQRKSHVGSVVLWRAKRNGEGEIISHLAPLCSEMLENSDPRREHGHPQD